ncbi:hypothetical protein GT348_09085 (plasmid) [Aristophania vespae]|uniref:Tetratricopeptide repeat protein n=2 Tax=Aristophania vespae TaxID=2697033 RepID=A0A6P1NNR9_9PROT|nr:tetratricopeptide repeat protein [Aristophania vespae]QHI96501.1 hypothetical protein GT348_09085 [Aristophania vespae]
MRKPGRIFSIKDPVSKEKLLIATSAFDDGGILSLRHGDHYDVWPSLEGVVVADHTPTQNIEMRRTENGALLNLGGEILPDIDQAVYANDVDLKWLGLRHLPVKDAETRYHNALLEAADSVPQERFEKRFEAAKAAFNVGDFLNARSIISVALDDDPEEAFRPDIRFFLGAISLLNGDIDEANLLDAQWPENDLRATQLWKGLYYAAIGKNNAEAAHLIANDFQRLLSYPDSLRPLILPMASEQIARYGTLEDMKALDSLPDEDNFSLARALRDLRIGKTDAAEKALTKLFNNQDPIIAEKAREAKISSDFSNNKLKPSEAVKKFSLLLPDARLAKREGIVRILQADAYMRDNQWENALSALDTVKHLTSQKADQRYTPMLHHILTNIARLPENTSHDPNDLNNLILHKAAILRAHLPELPAGPDKGDLLIAYGKMLSTLGLLDEASEVFSLAVPMMNTAVKKAEATNVLATSYLQRGKLDDASHILENSDNTSLPKSETAKRNRIIAQIAISSGKPEVALYLLNGDSDISAANLRAKIYEDRGEWPLAVQNVRQMAENLIPDKGNLTHSQQLLALRLASDASRAKDTATINWLIKKIDNRKFDNDTDHIFNLLVSPK